MCYYCAKGSVSVDEIVDHQLVNHSAEKKEFSIRKLQLDQSIGRKVYQSIHFHIPIADLVKRRDNGEKINIDIDSKKIKFKRVSQESSGETPLIYQYDTDIQEIVSAVLEKLCSVGRDGDFVAVLKAVADGTLSLTNMALHLFLDVGSHLRHSNPSQIRYSRTTLDFWLVVQKLFHGKGVRFFRGFSPSVTREGNFTVSHSNILVQLFLSLLIATYARTIVWISSVIHLGHAPNRNAST